MPCLDTILYHPVCRGRGLLPLLAFFRQVMEVSGASAQSLHSGIYELAKQGIEFLHERNIAHMVSEQ